MNNQVERDFSNKLQVLYTSNPDLTTDQISIVNSELQNFLSGGQFNNFNFTTNRYQSKIDSVIILGLFTIYANTQSIQLQIHAKQAVKDYLDPLFSPTMAESIIKSYNQKNGQFPIMEIDDRVKKTLQKTTEYYFNHLWNKWLNEKAGTDNTFLQPGFIGYYFYSITGGKGTQSKAGFPYFWNEFNKSTNASSNSAPEPSEIIKYVYGSKDTTRMNAFNSANKEIIQLIKDKMANPKFWKVFDYTVGSKLDNAEIVQMDSDFKNEREVSSYFDTLKKGRLSGEIDYIYKERGLDLPNFSSWKSTDLNKGPSDRGQLQPEPPELGLNPSGELSKVKYDKYGNKSYNDLKELRMLVKRVLLETLFSSKGVKSYFGKEMNSSIEA